MNKYKVICFTKPEVTQKHRIKIYVTAEDEDAAIARAYFKMKNKVFDQYNYRAWDFEVEKIENV